jgi:MerR family transcriptional regulator, heat shock protein HspR
MPLRPDWQARLDDPDEPLYALAVVSELLGLDPQVIRRYDNAGVSSAQRTSGNHRRYSRNDIRAIEAAAAMRSGGLSAAAMAEILVLRRQVATMQAEIERLSVND